MTTYPYEAIFCVVNAGYSETAMEAAKKCGARGGTVIHARGTANAESEALFGITVEPDKEIVMILVPSEQTDAILHGLYREVGLDTPGQGIAFALPADKVVGLSQPETKTT